jgi:hypothetical protein
LALTALPASLAVCFYTLPGTRRLPKERRVSPDGVTSIEERLLPVVTEAVSRLPSASQAI